MSGQRVRAIVRKELRDYRRNGLVVWTMALIPLIFTIVPLINIFALPPGSAALLRRENILIYMLGIPALAPIVVAAQAVVSERLQGTLEPVLTTPIDRRELLLGKALAAFIPSLAAAYLLFGIAIVSIELFAAPGVAAALVRGEEVGAQLIFTPLIAMWSIWIGIAISTRASDVRVAQQLGMLACVPTVIITSLIAYGVIHPSLRLALAFGIGLLIANRLGWRVTSAVFDRERLIASAK